MSKTRKILLSRSRVDTEQKFNEVPPESGPQASSADRSNSRPGKQKQLAKAEKTSGPIYNGKNESKATDHNESVSNVPLPKTKSVIRHIPPSFTEDEFNGLAAPYLPHIDWKYFVAGKVHKSKSKPATFARAYIKFSSVDHLLKFHKEFSGKVLKDNNGFETAIQIEFAPYEKIPRKMKSDRREGTIEKSEIYTFI
ncbi:Smg-4/UPF3 family-domain-containing protein [Lipomyces oligophaga]|uniref:Smg-4/UPF3 family-domain-containing protein n=1 Tax=Lipomyces oligophaga TaxID=45792 RepID=UPI0034CE609F